MARLKNLIYLKDVSVLKASLAPVAQWIERLFPKQKAVGSTPTWRDVLCFVFSFAGGPVRSLLLFSFLLILLP